MPQALTHGYTVFILDGGRRVRCNRSGHGHCAGSASAKGVAPGAVTGPMPNAAASPAKRVCSPLCSPLGTTRGLPRTNQPQQPRPCGPPPTMKSMPFAWGHAGSPRRRTLPCQARLQSLAASDRSRRLDQPAADLFFQNSVWGLLATRDEAHHVLPGERRRECVQVDFRG